MTVMNLAFFVFFELFAGRCKSCRYFLHSPLTVVTTADAGKLCTCSLWDHFLFIFFFLRFCLSNWYFLYVKIMIISKTGSIDKNGERLPKAIQRGADRGVVQDMILSIGDLILTESRLFPALNNSGTTHRIHVFYMRKLQTIAKGNSTAELIEGWSKRWQYRLKWKLDGDFLDTGKCSLNGDPEICCTSFLWNHPALHIMGLEGSLFIELIFYYSENIYKHLYVWISWTNRMKKLCQLIEEWSERWSTW